MQSIIWLKIEATKRYNKWATGGVHAYKSKPDTRDNEIAVKLTLEIPDEIFEEPVYEARLVMPKITRQLPEMSEVMRNTEKALSEKMGFKVKLEMPPELETNA